MILFDAELSPLYGTVPFNDGSCWRSHLNQVFSQAANTTLTAAAAASIVNNAGVRGNMLLPAGILNGATGVPSQSTPGRVIRTRVCGYGTTGATAGTITFYVKLGSTIIATTKAIVPIVNLTAVPFILELESTVKSTNVAGGTGTIDSFGIWHLGQLATATPDPGICNGSVAGTQAPATQAAVDQTTALLYDLWYSPSNALHSFTFTNITVETLF